MDVEVTERDGAVRVRLHVKPRASRSAVLGVSEDGAILVAVSAAPVDGAANAEIVRTLARWLGVPKRAVRLVTGPKSRRKVVELTGLARHDLLRQLGRLAG